ncbi:hypothetical protein WA026_014489 [Henosepilachna vigintioctopunctata]|uniref:NADH dehydrogenase [ubiquinone] 1 beta subcomplex subunit 2, mitochondrial n=1 Tax=Henosepilachna vigintioctopunctata TaxID=420089 RepID=A0AAW1UEQ1_9CUCU
MIISKGLSSLRMARLLQTSKSWKNPIQQTLRQAHQAYYRVSAPPNEKMLFLANCTQGLAWWWILWHIWTEPGHITGEFEYPDPSKWTDEELGIPS